MTKTRGRPKAFDENEVLSFAMEYFWEYGYETSSLENLLVVMGIKKSSFYHTFKSKEELFSRCLSLYREQNIQFLTTLKNDIGPIKAMLLLGQSTITQLQETGKVKGCLIVNSGKECYNKYADLSKQVDAEFNAINKLFIDFVEESKKSGDIKSTKPTTVIVGRYMNALNGLVITIQAGASDEMIKDIEEHLREILQ